MISCFWTLLTWSATHDGITSANLFPRVFSFSKNVAAEEKGVSPSLVPRPVRAIRVIRGGLEPRANFPYKPNWWRHIQNRRGRLGTRLGFPYSRHTGTQDDPGDQQSITIFLLFLPHLQRLAGLLNQTDTHFTVAWLVIEIVDNKNKGVIPHLCLNCFWNSSVNE